MANQAEKYMGPEQEGTAATGGIANPGQKDVKDSAADPSGEKMKALVWKGANKVAVVETGKPDIVDDEDAIVKVTGTSKSPLSMLRKERLEGGIANDVVVGTYSDLW